MKVETEKKIVDKSENNVNTLQKLKTIILVHLTSRVKVTYYGIIDALKIM